MDLDPRSPRLESAHLALVPHASLRIDPSWVSGTTVERNAALAGSIRAGDRDAEAFLWMKFAPPALMVLARRHSRHDAEDLTSTLFLIAIEELRNAAEPPWNLEAWLARIGFNLSVDLRRQRDRQRMQVLMIDPATASLDDPAEIAPTQEQFGLLLDAIEQLDERDRTIVLKHLDGVPYRQIADDLGMTEVAARVRFLRIRQRLARLARLESENHSNREPGVSRSDGHAT